MIPIPALILSLVFLALCGLHISWVLAERPRMRGFVPTVDDAPVFEPTPATTLVVAALLAGAAVVSLWRGGWPSVGPWWVPGYGIWIIAAVFAARAVGDFRYAGFFKRVRDTDFARNDSLVFTPLCVVISALAVWLAAAY